MPACLWEKATTAIIIVIIIISNENDATLLYDLLDIRHAREYLAWLVYLISPHNGALRACVSFLGLP